MSTERPKAVVLLSGGMDSCVTAAIANQSHQLALLHASYAQRTEARERRAFEEIADYYEVSERLLIHLDSFAQIGGSALTDRDIRVPESEETVAAEKVRLAMVPVGESRIELLEPTSPDSTIARFLEKRGEGLHHVALHVNDLAGTVKRLKASGTRLISDEIKVGAGGHRYVFVHPSSTGGVLLELVEDPHPGR